MFGLRSYLEMLLKADIFVKLCFSQAFDNTTWNYADLQSFASSLTNLVLASESIIPFLT